MKTLTEQEKQVLWEEVCKEFPDDRTMQEVHFARWVHHETLRGLPDSDKIEFYRQAGKRHPKTADAH